MIVVPYNCCALSVGAALVVAQFSFQMSPRWGLYWTIFIFYKHAAPLGLRVGQDARPTGVMRL